MCSRTDRPRGAIVAVLLFACVAQAGACSPAESAGVAADAAVEDGDATGGGEDTGGPPDGGDPQDAAAGDTVDPPDGGEGVDANDANDATADLPDSDASGVDAAADTTNDTATEDTTFDADDAVGADAVSDIAEEFALTSPAFADGETLPADLFCTRDGGDGASPPLAWTGAPAGAAGFALLMYHYPNGRVPGVDDPSQYWIVWGIEPSVTAIDRGNPLGLGFIGSDKDGRHAAYTPPCSPPGSGAHEYHIRLYALSAFPEALGRADDVAVTYAPFVAAVDPLTLATTELSFVHETPVTP